MTPDRIAELLAPFLGDADDQRLTTDDLQNISTYIDILLRWNARINLTAIRDPEEIVTRHFGESLFAARILFPTRSHVETAALGYPAERSSAQNQKELSLNRAEPVPPEGRVQLEKKVEPLVPGRGRETVQTLHRAGRGGRVEGQETVEALAADGGRAALQGRVTSEKTIGALAPVSSLVKNFELADIGSGAGFPGIPIKLWQPRVALTLIDSNQKKATFLREVARALTLTDINILNARAETLTTTSFDVVTLRAVERFESTLPAAARLVAPGGRLALLIGSNQLPLAESITCRIHGFEANYVIRPIPLSRSRLLALSHRSRLAPITRID